MKRIKLKTFINAMYKNGYPKLTDGGYIGYRNGKVAACAYGQAALNLNVDPAELHNAVSTLLMNISGNKDLLTVFPVTSRITITNDGSDKTVPQIALEVKEELKDYLDTFISIEEAH